MALQGILEDEFGVVHNEAYAKVVELAANWLQGYARITMAVYHNQASRDNQKTPVKTFIYTLNSQPSNQKIYVFDPETGERLVGSGGEFITANGPIFSQVFGTDILDLASVNVVSQGYALIKAMPEWYDWTDV